MRAVRPRLMVPGWRRSLRPYSASHATSRSDVEPASASGSVSPGPWAPAKGAPFTLREVPSKGLAFASTNKKAPDLGVKVLPYIWLRDNCRCSDCVHPHTRQRNFNTFKIPTDIKPESLQADVSALTIQWSHDSHKSVYTWDFLKSYIKGDRPDPEDVQPEYFGVGGHPDAHVAHHELGENETAFVGRLTDKIMRKGFAVVTGVPTDSAKPTEELLRRIAFIRETHYGCFYDFEADLALADTAYTNIALAAHTDTTYFTDPAGLQAFHLLSHTDNSPREDAERSLGGQSLLVDGFYAAQKLKTEEPRLFEILTNYNLPWHASGNEGITIVPDKLYPVLEWDQQRNTMLSVRWNNDDRGVVPFSDKYTVEEWYEAARYWAGILERKEMEYWFQLKPGEVLIFNNKRVLHGRSAFTGSRRMCGGYINWDDFVSRWRNTNYGRDEIEKRTIG